MSFFFLDFAEPQLVLALHELRKLRPALVAELNASWDRLVELTRASNQNPYDYETRHARSSAWREWQRLRAKSRHLASRINAARERIEKSERRARRATDRAAREAASREVPSCPSR